MMRVYDNYSYISSIHLTGLIRVIIRRLYCVYIEGFGEEPRAWVWVLGIGLVQPR
jgi:hypothetical protein